MYIYIYIYIYIYKLDVDKLVHVSGDLNWTLTFQKKLLFASWKAL